MTVPLTFLAPGKAYEAQIYRDGDDADFRTEKRHYRGEIPAFAGMTGKVWNSVAFPNFSLLRLRATG